MNAEPVSPVVPTPANPKVSSIHETAFIMLGQIKDNGLRVYVVCVLSLPADNESKVPAATTKIPDERASLYWDANSKLKKGHQRVMKMGEPAWDVYYVYGRDAEWKSEPPVSGYHIHQLHGLPPERMLDGDKLAEEMNKLLR